MELFVLELLILVTILVVLLVLVTILILVLVVGIVLERADAEHLGQLHLGPEMSEMEADKADDDDAEHKHVACGPGICGGVAGHLIAFHSATCYHVLDRKPAAVEDVDGEAEGEDGHHDGDHGSAHEVAAELEESVTCAEKLVVSGSNTELAGECVYDREEIDSGVKKEEYDKKCSGHGLDEFLSDG